MIHSLTSRSLVWLATLLILAYLALMPLLPVDSGGGHDLARTAQLIVLVIAAGSLVGAAGVRGHPSTWARSYLLLALTLPLMSIAWAAEAPMVAAREFALMVGLAALAWALSRNVRQPAGLALMVKGVITAWALYFASFLLVFAAVVAAGSGVNLWLMILGYDNPRFLNHAQTLGIPLLLGVLNWPGLSMRWRALAWFAVVMNFAVLMLTFGRATGLAVCAVLAVAALGFGPAGRRYATQGLLAAGVGLLVYLLLFRGLPSVLAGGVTDGVPGLTHAVSDHSRFYLWAIAWDHIVGAPWLGIGPMHYAHFPNGKGAHPHNVYLQVAAEYGLPMLALLVVGGAWALWQAARRLRQQLLDVPAQTWGLGAWCACLAALIDGGFSGNFVMPVSQVWIAVSAGLLMAAWSQQAPTCASSTSRFLRGLILCLLLAQVLNLAASLREFAEDRPRLSIKADADTGDKWRPRFWLDGWF